jgi:hypothetical protein
MNSKVKKTNNKEIIRNLEKTIEITSNLETKNLLSLILERHKKFMSSHNGISMSLIWGKMQSGKTFAMENISNSFLQNFPSQETVATLTLSDVMLYAQLKAQLDKCARVEKLYDLVNMSDTEFDEVFKHCNLLLIDEIDYGQEDGGRFSKLIQRCFSKKIHLIAFGATNWTATISELNTLKVKLDIEHFAIKPASTKEVYGYFGIQEFVKNKNIIDIECGDYSIHTDSGKISKKMKETIISLNNKIPGLSCIRTSNRDKGDKKQITIATKLKESLEKDKDFKDYVIVPVFDQKNGKPLKDRFQDAQRYVRRGKKVIVIVIGGLSAGIAIDMDLKRSNKLRFAYEPSNVASSAMQGLPGRFCGYYYDVIPDSVIVCSMDAAILYCKIWNNIETNGIIDSSDLNEFDGKKPSPHMTINRKEIKHLPIPAKLVWKGVLNQVPIQFSKRGEYYTTKFKKSNGDINPTFDKIGYEQLFQSLNVSKQISDIRPILYSISKETVEYKQYAHIIYNKGVRQTSNTIMVYEIIDRIPKLNQTASKETIKNKSHFGSLLNG